MALVKTGATRSTQPVSDTDSFTSFLTTEVGESTVFERASEAITSMVVDVGNAPVGEWENLTGRLRLLFGS